jgi:hypothetical protein
LIKEGRKKPDCLGCRHYYVTWDERFPRGCRAMRFKSRRPPSEVVYENSGIDCQMFEPKGAPGRPGP